MSARVRQVALSVIFALTPVLAVAQATWQPASPPLVTADNEPWFQAGSPIIWSGDYYYPTGAPRYFSPNEMVRSGSFHGIPLYTDATLDPYSIVYVPIAGGLMQPYQRRRDGSLAGTTGNTAPAFPPAPASELRDVQRPAGVAEMDELREAAAPPSYARPYDVSPLGERPRAGAAVATAGRAPSAGREETALRPVGVNGIWIMYEGHRWFADGLAMSLAEGRFTRAGSYHGFPVYRLNNDPTRIYIPSADGLVSPFALRK